MQLSLFSTPVSAVCMMLYDHDALYERNLLVGFSWLIVLAVSLNALGGIAVSMALKCARPRPPPPHALPTPHALHPRHAPHAPTLCSLCKLCSLCTLCTRAPPRYADNIQKTFAVGISIVLNCLVRGCSRGPCAS